jgi:hypothetical protein
MPNEITIKGTVHELFDTQSFPSGFSKRILVIKTNDEKYPQTIPVEFVKEKCDALDQLSIGQGVTAYVNLRGNEHNGKYYASIQGWKFEAGQEPARTAAHSQSAPKRTAAGGVATTEKGWDDDDTSLPF